MGDEVPEPACNDLADLDVPNSAAAAAGPAVAKLATEDDSSAFFLLLNSEPNNPSFSFLVFSFSFSLPCFLPNSPPFFSFCLAGWAAVAGADEVDTDDVFEAVRASGGRSMVRAGGTGPFARFWDMLVTLDPRSGGAMPGRSSGSW